MYRLPGKEPRLRSGRRATDRASALYAQTHAECCGTRTYTRFHGESGDLQELLGNLLENAFKWAQSRVLLTVAEGATASNRRSNSLNMATSTTSSSNALPSARSRWRSRRG